MHEASPRLQRVSRRARTRGEALCPPRTPQRLCLLLLILLLLPLLLLLRLLLLLLLLLRLLLLLLLLLLRLLLRLLLFRVLLPVFWLLRGCCCCRCNGKLYGGRRWALPPRSPTRCFSRPLLLLLLLRLLFLYVRRRRPSVHLCNVRSSLHGSSHEQEQSRQLRQVGCLSLRERKGRSYFQQRFILILGY